MFLRIFIERSEYMKTIEEIKVKEESVVREFVGYMGLEEYNTYSGKFYVDKKRDILVGLRIFTTERRTRTGEFISSAWPNALQITHIYVPEEKRGQGIFSKFVDDLMAFCYEQSKACVVFPTRWEFKNVFTSPHEATIEEFRYEKKDKLVEMYHKKGFFEIVTALKGKMNTNSRRTRDEEYYHPLTRKENLGVNALALDTCNVLPSMLNLEKYKAHHKL
jgi:GNAT superfamily N-acetyltransferase